jgi:hypothetical protein
MIFLYTLTLGVIHGIFTVVATEATLSENPTAWIPKKDLSCVSRRLPYYCHMVSQIIQFSFYLQFYETRKEIQRSGVLFSRKKGKKERSRLA